MSRIKRPKFLAGIAAEADMTGPGSSIFVSSAYDLQTMPPYMAPTLESALGSDFSFLSPSPSTPLTIVLESETHLIDSALTIPAGVSLGGRVGDTYQTVLSFTSAVATGFTCAGQCAFTGMTILGNTNVTTMFDNTTTPGANCFFNNMTVQGATTMWNVGNGTITIVDFMNVLSVPFNTISTIATVTGAGTLFTIQSAGIFNFTGTPLTGFVLTAGAEMQSINAFSSGMALYVDNDNSTYFGFSLQVRNCVEGIRARNNADVFLSGVSFLDNTMDLIMEDPTAMLNSSSAVFDITKSQLNSNSYVIHTDNTVETRGTHVVGDLFIGSEILDSNVYMGTGSISYSRFKAFTTPDDVAFADVTAALIPGSGSTATFWPTLAIGETVYLGDFFKFSGWEITVVTAYVYASSPLLPYVVEYWDGTAWVSINNMTVGAVQPYPTRQDILFGTVETQETRLDNRILRTTANELNAWQMTTVNGTNAFFIRLRLTDTITTAPVLESIRLTGNTTRVDEHGFNRYYGTARPKVILPFDINLLRNLSGNAPNADVYSDVDLGVARVNNVLRDTGDSLQAVFYLAGQQDTSTPVELVLTFFTSGTDTADIELIITYGCSSTGAELDTSGAGLVLPRKASTVATLPPLIIDTTSRQTTVQIPLSGSKCTPRNLTSTVVDIIWLDITRDGSDVNGDNMILLQATLAYTEAFSGLNPL